MTTSRVILPTLLVDGLLPPLSGPASPQLDSAVIETLLISLAARRRGGPVSEGATCYLRGETCAASFGPEEVVALPWKGKTGCPCQP